MGIRLGISLVLLCYWSCALASSNIVNKECPRTPKELGETKKYTIAGKPTRSIDLYINKALPYSPLHAFTDVFLATNLTDQDKYKIYQGPNCSAVLDEYHDDNRLFGLLKSVSLWRGQQLYPFNDTVVGVDTADPYTIHTTAWKVNVIRVGIFVGSVLLFLFASSLVRNTVFYYTSGCSFGLFASLLLVAFLVYRVAPKKTIGIPMLLGGWSVSLYMLNFAWNNLAYISDQYQKYVIAYFVSILLISFAVCYKRGPPTDTRSHDIAQWTLQLVALVFLYASSQIPEVSFSVMAVLIAHQLTKSWLWYLLGSIGRSGRWFWRKLFPVAPRLLSEEEYEQQKDETTRAELDKLRSFCRSPAADKWKITRTVRNPQRLARFIDGTENHISDDEEQEYLRDPETLDRYDDFANGRDEFDDDDEWDHEIVIRRTPRNGNQSFTETAQTIRLPREVYNRIVAGDRVMSSTGGRLPPTSRLPRPSRHSLGGGVLPNRHPTLSDLRIRPTATGTARSTPRAKKAVSDSAVPSSSRGPSNRLSTSAAPVPPKTRRSANLGSSFLSSDSEDDHDLPSSAEADLEFERD